MAENTKWIRNKRTGAVWQVDEAHAHRLLHPPEGIEQEYEESSGGEHGDPDEPAEEVVPVPPEGASVTAETRRAEAEKRVTAGPGAKVPADPEAAAPGQGEGTSDADTAEPKTTTRKTRSKAGE